MIHVTAISTAAPDPNARPAAGAGRGNKQEHPEKTHYSCPIYKYPKRNDKYLITRVWLRPDSAKDTDKKDNSLPIGMKPQINWKLKGVALLCTKE